MRLIFITIGLDIFYKDPLSPALLPEVCGDRELYFCNNYRDEYALDPLPHWTFFEECKLINIRFDFAVVNWYKQTKLLIELDGHEYHKTVEQGNNDAIKRIIATNRGWQLNVFTGTQIKRDIEHCFKSIKKFLEK